MIEENQGLLTGSSKAKKNAKWRVLNAIKDNKNWDNNSIPYPGIISMISIGVKGKKRFAYLETMLILKKNNPNEKVPKEVNSIVLEASLYFNVATVNSI